jgi:hypothetical protein
MASRPEGYIGTLAVTWEDGARNVFEISQSRGHIWVGEHFVSVRNEKSMQGILLEIGDVMSYPPKKVKQHTWLELVTPLKYPQ